jgi:hypothetical protein
MHPLSGKNTGRFLTAERSKSPTKTERLERWQSARDWHSDGLSANPGSVTASKDSYNSL